MRCLLRKVSTRINHFKKNESHKMNVYPSRINTPRRVYIYIYMNFFKREHFSCSDQFMNLNRTIWVPATLRVWGPGFLEVNVIPLQKGSSKKKNKNYERIFILHIATIVHRSSPLMSPEICL